MQADLHEIYIERIQNIFNKMRTKINALRQKTASTLFVETCYPDFL